MAPQLRGGSVTLCRRLDFVGEIHCDPDRLDGVLARLDKQTGFLQLDARLTTVGVFKYSDAEGNVWGELRTETEVFSDDSMRSFHLVTATNEHPDAFVDIDNVRDVQVGTVGSDVRRDGVFVRASIVITDASTILAIQRGKCQLSCGYTSEVIAETGVANGDKFDGVQTKIRGNHVAIVTKGRAGPDCSLIARGDAAYSEVQMQVKKQDAKKRAEAMITKLKGKRDGEHNAEQAQSLIELLTAAMKTKNEMLIEAALVQATAILAGKVEEPSAEPEPEAEPEAVLEGGSGHEEPQQAAAGLLQAQPGQQPSAFDSSTALSAKVHTLEAARAQDAASFSQRVSARVALERSALAICPELSLDGLSDDAIRRAVVLAVTPGVEAKLDSHKAAPGYLRAMFDTAVELHYGRAHHADELGRVVFDAHNEGSGELDLDQLHADYLERRNGWKTPARKDAN